jgi:hypothetical protein
MSSARPDPTTDGTEPDWVSDAARLAWAEARHFVRTVAAFIRGPRRFAAAWAEGRGGAMHPLGYLLNALAVLLPYQVCWSHLSGDSSPAAPVWLELVRPAVYVAGNVVFAVVSHVLLLLGGSRRRLTSTVAMALYASGGPMTLASLMIAPLLRWGASPLVLWLPLCAFLVTYAAATKGLHRVSWNLVHCQPRGGDHPVPSGMDDDRMARSPDRPVGVRVNQGSLSCDGCPSEKRTYIASISPSMRSENSS